MRHVYQDYAHRIWMVSCGVVKAYYYHWSEFTCIIGNYFVLITTEEQKHLIAENDPSIFVFHSPSSSTGLSKYTMYFCHLWLLQDKITF